ncbi:MAG: lactoylglutathione lyase [Euryarchaeota archaeon]|jgi:lactoylglutathione lyase|nr:lactoylglutathione lyase [Euryarchaeota archaeon]MDP6364448.1 VOC family protein [Candidatus Poseidoniia archaeon]MDP6658381.1 VOC family protein [Candidatus Poseidoniia archaeon]MDP7007821.1 VOC family protein [Candidatus Poseidoniia archaeon]|tara:strand:- start:6 stop:392 length:387 start_codon:yes stop_codon:yes gene_type:complete
MGFAHTSITVRDMEASIAFYERWLGMRLERRHPIESTRADIAFLEDPATGALLELTWWWDKQDWNAGDELDHLAFYVPDVAALVAEARKAGVEIAKEPYSLPGSATKLAFLKDPNGIWIELIERTGKG